jgi:hypothetical protein
MVKCRIIRLYSEFFKCSNEEEDKLHEELERKICDKIIIFPIVPRKDDIIAVDWMAKKFRFSKKLKELVEDDNIQLTVNFIVIYEEYIEIYI